ncbi:MAG: HAMP domain-containing histidine kinase [Pirellulales bacterium]|nr:HAMP domain-containing histidine kinase [Pirellulales bacterium]
MRWPLHRQIMLPLIAVALGSLTALGAINARLAARHARLRIERQLQGVVSVLADSNFPLTNRVLRQMRQLSQAEFVLADADGRPLASSDAAVEQAFAIAAPGASRAAMPGQPLALGGRAYLHTAAKLPARPGESHSATLHVLFPESEYRRSWREAFLPPLVIGLACVTAVTLVARLLAGRIGRASVRLSGEVLRLAGGDFTAIDVPATDDEFRDLSLAVNQTASRLADYERQVRQTEQMRTAALLGAGLAHDLRNAATGCRMALDLHAESCPSAGGETVAVAKRQLQLMENHLQRLLHAVRPGAVESRTQFDLAQLVDELLPLVEPMAKHAGVELAWQSAPTAMILADQEAIGQVVLNLLINAIEAARTPPRSPVARVAVELNCPGATRAALTVSDSGPGLSNAAARALFDPFFTTKPEGVGLGLAAARQVVQSHRGSIQWTRHDGQTRFCIEIPLATKGNERV